MALHGAGNQRRHELLLLLLREVAGIVHRRRPRRAAVAGGVHREHVEAGLREVRHPAVVAGRHIERDFGGRAGAVDEQHDAIGGGIRHAFGDALAHVDLRGLPGDRRHDRFHRDLVIDGEDLARVGPVCAESRRRQERGGDNASAISCDALYSCPARTRSGGSSSASATALRRADSRAQLVHGALAARLSQQPHPADPLLMPRSACRHGPASRPLRSRSS